MSLEIKMRELHSVYVREMGWIRSEKNRLTILEHPVNGWLTVIESQRKGPMLVNPNFVIAKI